MIFQIRYNYLLKDLKTTANGMLNDYDNQLKKGTITEVLKYLNKPEELKRNLSLYLKFMTKTGAGKNFASYYQERAAGEHNEMLTRLLHCQLSG